MLAKGHCSIQVNQSDASIPARHPRFLRIHPQTVWMCCVPVSSRSRRARYGLVFKRLRWLGKSHFASGPAMMERADGDGANKTNQSNLEAFCKPLPGPANGRPGGGNFSIESGLLGVATEAHQATVDGGTIGCHATGVDLDDLATSVSAVAGDAADCELAGEAAGGRHGLDLELG